MVNFLVERPIFVSAIAVIKRLAGNTLGRPERMLRGHNTVLIPLGGYALITGQRR